MAGKHNLFWFSAAVVTGVTLYSMKRRKEKPTLIVKDSLPFGFNAFTLPPIGVYVTRDQAENEALLKHELVHWKQFQEMGLLRYYLCYASQYVANGYDGMQMEKQARAECGETDYCQDNYTDCVRGGNAKTVFNPSFKK